MAIGDEFDPEKNGWFFQNWNDANLSWDLYRRAYLAINPTQDLVEAPLDCAFYEIFKILAKNGNCGGMSMLGLALYKYGGFMGFCGPQASTPATTLSMVRHPIPPLPSTTWRGPDSADLHAAINVMQGRQFGAAGVQNFLDVAAAGQLNNAEAAYAGIKSGLASGDYSMLSMSNGLSGKHAHTVIPYQVEERTPGTKVIHVWDPDRPYEMFSDFYDPDHGNNTIMFTSPTARGSTTRPRSTRIRTALRPTPEEGFTTGRTGGWCFSIPISLELHKGRQPFSVGFAATALMTIFRKRHRSDGDANRGRRPGDGSTAAAACIATSVKSRPTTNAVSRASPLALVRGRERR